MIKLTPTPSTQTLPNAPASSENLSHHWQPDSGDIKNHPPGDIVNYWLDKTHMNRSSGLSLQQLRNIASGPKVPVWVQKAFAAITNNGGQNFARLDKDHNGKLTSKEIAATPTGKGLPDSKTQAGRYVYDYYTGHPNSNQIKLTLDDIKRMAHDSSIDPGLRAAMQALAKNDGALARKYDRDHNGWLTVEDLAHFQ